MIYLQAVLSETGLASRLFDLLDEDAFVLFTSPKILEELKNVLNRPKLRRKYSQITDKRIEAFLFRVSQKAI